MVFILYKYFMWFYRGGWGDTYKCMDVSFVSIAPAKSGVETESHYQI